jgi:hypothetical protein
MHREKPWRRASEEMDTSQQAPAVSSSSTPRQDRRPALRGALSSRGGGPGGPGKRATSDWKNDWVVSDFDPWHESRLAMVWTLEDETRAWVEARADCTGDVPVAVTPPAVDGGSEWRVPLDRDKHMRLEGNPRIRRAEGTWCVLDEPVEARP